MTALISAVWSGAFSLFTSSNYLPHRFCYLAQPGLVWTNVVMDGLIAASYAAIFASLFWVRNRLRRVAALKNYLWIFIAFGTFIVACGATHAMEIVTVWWPVYPLAAAVKVVCAAASVPTAVLFFRTAPALTENVQAFILTLSTTQQQKDQALLSLVAAEKLAVAGRISASIAHEIKNPLDSIGNVLYLIRDTPGISAETVSLIDIASSELSRAGHIASNTLSLYRESAKPVALALPELIQSVLDLQQPALLRRNIKIETSIDAPTPIHAFPGELRQILINLIQNALDATPNRGQILIRLRPGRSWFRPVSPASGSPAPGYAITVTDNGSGIPVAVRDRLFIPFSTTKGEEGTGLGLWLVQSLIAKQGGHIRFRSRVAGSGSAPSGTIFRIWLPLQSSGSH